MCRCMDLDYCPECCPEAFEKKKKEPIKEEINRKNITFCGGTRGVIDVHQRRPNTKIHYDVWLEQGYGDDPREFFIAEGDIDLLILYLQSCKEGIEFHKNQMKQLGEKV